MDEWKMDDDKRESATEAAIRKQREEIVQMMYGLVVPKFYYGIYKDEQDATAAVDYVAEYLGLKRQIAALETEAQNARDAVAEILHGEPGKEWEFPGIGSVAVVKGRVSEKLDRSVLAAAGVSKDLLDAATIRSEGEPSLRITAEKQTKGKG
jgi:hypothetical protein